jgi:hypothetical protein
MVGVTGSIPVAPTTSETFLNFLLGQPQTRTRGNDSDIADTSASFRRKIPRVGFKALAGQLATAFQAQKLIVSGCTVRACGLARVPAT